jgi:hypothetical protein
MLLHSALALALASIAAAEQTVLGADRWAGLRAQLGARLQPGAPFAAPCFASDDDTAAAWTAGARANATDACADVRTRYLDECMRPRSARVGMAGADERVRDSCAHGHAGRADPAAVGGLPAHGRAVPARLDRQHEPRRERGAADVRARERLAVLRQLGDSGLCGRGADGSRCRSTCRVRRTCRLRLHSRGRRRSRLSSRTPAYGLSFRTVQARELMRWYSMTTKVAAAPPDRFRCGCTT